MSPQRVEGHTPTPDGSGEIIHINGVPATPELWDSWMESIGAGPKARKATRKAQDEIVKLSQQLKAQAEKRELEREP